MRFLKYNFLPLSLCVLASFTTLDSKISFAGGDPTIKDQKVKSSKSNIKQHRSLQNLCNQTKEFVFHNKFNNKH